MPRKLTTEEFIERSKKIHGDKYDYSLTTYMNNNTKIKIICPDHGVFEQTPNMHKDRKNGCPKCSRKNTVALEVNIKRSETIKSNNFKKYGVRSPKQRHYNIQNYNKLNKEYIYENFVDIDGYFLTDLFASFIGCSNVTALRIIKRFGVYPKFKQHSFDPNKSAILYYIQDLETGYYKIGITNHSVNYRFRLKKGRYKTIKEWVFPLGADAEELENFLHKELSDKHVINESWAINKKSTDGKTEFFQEDVLNLDG